MIKFLLIALFLPLNLLVNFACHAEDDVDLVFVNLPTLISNEPGKQGKYNQAFDQILPHFSGHLNNIFMPPTRAYLAFSKGMKDCIFPANSSTINNHKSLIVSKSFGEAHAHVFTLSARPVIKDSKALEGLRLGIRRGFDYGGYNFSSSIDTIEVDSIEQNLMMLASERIDAFVAYEPDALTVFAQNPEISIHRDKGFTIYSQFDQIACHQSPTNLDFITQINQAMNLTNIID